MRQFEFFMIIVSVLIAIAISELAGWWGRLIRSDRKTGVVPLHLGWKDCLKRIGSTKA